MRTIELVTGDGKSIYRGQHHFLNEAIESAIKKNIPLDGIDLSYQKLHHINLDGVKFHNASFEGADLTGANMSEADFLDCNFSFANLNDACLCYSNIMNCNLRLSQLKDADISMASLINCEFEGFNTFQLRFDSAFKIQGLVYHNFAKQHIFTLPPTVIKAANKAFALLDNTMIIKDNPHTFECGNIDSTALKTPSKRMQSMIDFKNQSM